MSKHNNNNNPSSHARCKCGRYATIGEWKAGIGLKGIYECPDCVRRKYAKPLTSEEYLRSMGIKP
ncbi:MAG: hypothetical protein KatS3mg035_1068 [Bacteroidia bacterium]|nr:MAG: hypothetical protein KatS3mg035_1068 [Bacteroidia bacterium]